MKLPVPKTTGVATQSQVSSEYKHELLDYQDFNAQIAGIPVEKLFDFRARKYEWLRNFKTYPAGLDQRMIQKVILNTAKVQLLDGFNGDRNRYIVFGAYHIISKYKPGFIEGEYFPMMFPRATFTKMIENTVFKPLDYFQDMLIELHFKKASQTRYVVYYLAQVEQLGEREWARKKVFFHKKKYNADITYKGDKE